MSTGDYMRARLKLLDEGKALVGTPEEYIARHTAANVARTDARRILNAEFWARKNRRPDNLDLVGG